MPLEKNKKKKLAFIVQMPKKISPGQRFRFEIWEELLNENNFEIDTFSFIDRKTQAVLYQPGNLFAKMLGVFRGFLKRIVLLPKLTLYDYIVVQREFAPIGPPILEWIAVKILRCKIIYDFDDAIWIPASSQKHRWMKWLKASWKVKYLCKWAYRVVPGNEYLAEFARKWNSQVTIIPTCVDVLNSHVEKPPAVQDRLVIGWTGSHTTLFYLDAVVPALQTLSEEFDFSFLVIADQKPNLPIRNLEFIRWNEKTEISDLSRMDIGLMPLHDDEWSSGKCGFKLIQYLALGIPALASPVGVNQVIARDGVGAILCSTEHDWLAGLRKLMQDSELRKKMGNAGRIRVAAEFSIQANAQLYLRLFT